MQLKTEIKTFFVGNGEVRLTQRSLINLLNTTFAPQGSNLRRRQEQAYRLFVTYVREVTGMLNESINSCIACVKSYLPDRCYVVRSIIVHHLIF